jgi:hypothetical protein
LNGLFTMFGIGAFIFLEALPGSFLNMLLIREALLYLILRVHVTQTFVVHECSRLATSRETLQYGMKKLDPLKKLRLEYYQEAL